MDKLLAGKTVSVTEEGFMTEFSQWDRSIADAIAAENDVTLSARHWEVIDYIQTEYKNDTPLSIRKIGKTCKLYLIKLIQNKNKQKWKMMEE